jgi:hypothetical protein
MSDHNRRPEHQPTHPTQSKPQQQNRQLDPEQRDREASNDGQVRRPGGVLDDGDAQGRG